MLPAASEATAVHPAVKPSRRAPWAEGGWLLLLALSAALLLYPVNPSLEYAPVQAVTAIPNLPLFSTLFFPWAVLLLALLALGRPGSPWKHAALLVLFVAVTQGVWVLATQGHMREAVLYGRMVDHITAGNPVDPSVPNFGYFNWPGSFIAAAAISYLGGIATWPAVVALQLTWGATFATSLYLLLRRASGSPTAAWMGTLVVLLGSLQTAKLLQQFHPGTFGMALFVAMALTAAALRVHERPSWRALLVLAVLMGAVTVTHFVTSVTVVLTAVGVGAVALVGRERLSPRYLVVLLGLGLAGVGVVGAWLGLYARDVLASLLAHGAATLTQVLGMSIGVDFMLAWLLRTYLGGAMPPWALAVQYGWLLLLYLGGGVLAVAALVRLRRLDGPGRLALGIALGVGLMGVASFLTGAGNVIRLFTFAPIVLAMFLALFVARLGIHQQRPLAYGVALVLALAALPSFLVQGNTINLNAMRRPPELHLGQALARSYGDGAGLLVFAQTIPWQAHLPFAAYRHPHPGYLGSYDTGVFVAAYRDESVAFLADPMLTEKAWLFILSARDLLDYQFLLGEDVRTIPTWDQVRAALLGTNRVYDTREVVLYLREAPRA